MSVISKEEKQKIMGKFALALGDTGSPEVQVAVLTSKIKALTEHLKENTKDFQTHRGLLVMVNRRKRLLSYLRKVGAERYLKLCQSLGLKVRKF